jgi:hypothetical protein
MKHMYVLGSSISFPVMLNIFLFRDFLSIQRRLSSLSRKSSLVATPGAPPPRHGSNKSEVSAVPCLFVVCCVETLEGLRGRRRGCVCVCVMCDRFEGLKNIFLSATS